MRRTGASRTDRGRIETRDRLLLAILPHVAFDGWTRRALVAGADDEAMAPADVDRFFPGGVREIIGHFGDWADRQMIAALDGRDVATLKVRERVALAVRLRLEVLARHREALRRAVAWLALPPNAPLAMRGLWRTADAIWYATGDRSADFSYYTKRALLVGVLSTTTLYWLDDRSEGSEASWAFLDRRIADVMRIPALKGRVERLAAHLPDPFRILRAARGR